MKFSLHKIKFSLFSGVLLSSINIFAQGPGVGPAPYCMPAYSNRPCNQPGLSNAAGNFINDFNQSFSTAGATSNISNNNSGCNSQILGSTSENYFFVACPTFLRCSPGQVITCNFLSGNTYDQGFAVFVDWNNNSVYAPGELMCGTPGVPLATTPASAVFSVPAGQPAGNYRLRLRCAYATPGVTIDPCINYGYGETEEYNVVVGAAGGCPVLPIELIAFDAAWKNNSAELKWTTALEVNTDYFLVEKSYDGEKFETYGMVTAMGNSFSNKTYSIIDEKVNRKGTIYYRLQEFDKGGSEPKLSKIVSLVGNVSSDTSFELYPNPASSEMKVLMPEILFGKTVTIEAYDTFGRKVYSSEIAVDSDNSSFSINISELNRGTYFIKVDDNSGISLKKTLIKQ